MKALLTGNEAIAQGAYESGVRLVAGYPGAPCTEVMEGMRKYEEVYCEWSTNEKVALEVAMGASFAGYRSLALMKTVGLNVAADAFMFSAGTQLNGGLVIVISDDVGRIAGDDYNDGRFYGLHGNVPVLEPSDSQDARDFVKVAFEISEEYSTPVIIRLTSVTCRTKCLVEIDEKYIYNSITNKKYEYSYPRTIITTIMMGFNNPNTPKLKKYYNDFTGTMKLLEDNSNDMPLNILELRSKEIGVITAGITYCYAKEVLPDASILKLGLINPLPKALIQKIAAHVKNLYILEEGQNVLERNVRSLGINVVGEELFPKFPKMTRFTPDVIEEKLKEGFIKVEQRTDVPFRLPMNCAGCSHLFVYHILKKNKIKATTDVTCGGIGNFPHVDAFLNAKCMGSSIGITHGYNVVSNEKRKFVAVIGDGGFWNTGISGLINLIYNAGNSAVIIMDNSCIAMTGGQGCPSSGFGINHKPENNIDIEKICNAIGIHNVVSVDAYDFEKLESSILNATNCEGNAVVIAKRPCITVFKPEKSGTCRINEKSCSKCKVCIKIGCLAIERKINDDFEEIRINKDLCMGCKLCTHVCIKGAIEYVQK